MSPSFETSLRGAFRTRAGLTGLTQSHLAPGQFGAMVCAITWELDMREARTLLSWGIALFLAAMLIWIVVDTLAPPTGTKNHLFALFAETSGIAYFEPSGRLAFGVLEVLIAVLVFVPVTRRFGAILGVLLLGVLAVLVGQLMMLQVQIPVDAVGEGGAVTTAMSDPGALFYLVVGLLVAALALIFIHPGREEVGGKPYYAR